MRKLVGAMSLLLMFAACQKEENSPLQENQEIQEIEVDMSDFSLYVENDGLVSKSEQGAEKCETMKNLEYRLSKNNGLAKKMYDIEYNTRKAIALKNGQGGGKPGGGGGTPSIYEGPVTIPVVINIIEQFSGQVTQAQIDSQIRILNEDFQNNNNNTVNVPREFSGLVADMDITFTLAGVNKVVNTRTSWGTNDAMKDPGQGGIAATNPDSNLNFWVCEIGGGILGYAQFPGGNASTDGVVVGTDFFGESQAGGIYGKGRTATHEVGHWLNLRHIWGDGRCNRDDFVADTPTSDGPNYNCPSYPTVRCRSTDMTMNYMDYVQDDCMYMFSLGQSDRMRALFVSGGPRDGFVN